MTVNRISLYTDFTSPLSVSYCLPTVPSSEFIVYWGLDWDQDVISQIHWTLVTEVVGLGVKEGRHHFATWFTGGRRV